MRLLDTAPGAGRVRAPVKAQRRSKRPQHGASRLQKRSLKIGAGWRKSMMPVACMITLALGLMGAKTLAPILGNWIDGPIREVRVQGTMRFQDPQAVRRQLERMQLGSFFGLEMLAIQQRVESLPWVRSVNLRRVWPSTLELHVSEQNPIAVWGQQALLSEQGELFAPQNLLQVEGLPVFDGPAGFERQMMQAFAGFSPVLAEAGLAISELRLSARGAWEIELKTGQLIRLGRTETLRRLERFTDLHRGYLEERLATVAVVDTRYSHGIAVTWKPGVKRPEEERG